MTVEQMKERIYSGIRKEMLHGVQAIRTHIDVTDPTFTGLKAALEVRDEVKDILDLQIVAFPQEGMYAYKDGDKLVEEGLKMGADCVGAIPHFELAREFGEKSIHKTIELAVKYNKLIDVHCDETDDTQSRFLELLNALALMEGIGTRTTASHTCSFGSADNSYVFRMMKLFKKSGINFISCPTENVYLEGRQDTYPKRRGITRVTTYDKDLYEKTLKEDAREEGREEGLMEGRARGREEGRVEGREEGMEYLNQLNKYLLKSKRYNDLERATEDIEYQKKLLKELGIE